jgi:type II secretion system protein J
MTRHRGFTLIELSIALAITGLVALLVYAAADAGYDTRRRLDASRRSLQSARAMRILLQDALRNARPAVRIGDSAFTLEKGRGPAGQPADRLIFVTGGGLAPLAGGRDWLVRVEPSTNGLGFSALPLDGSRGGRFVGRLDGVTGLKVRVKGAGLDTAWADRWARPSSVPKAVELTYWTAAGPVGLPLLVALPLGGPP